MKARKRVDRRIFKRTASLTRKINVAPKLQRGCLCL